MKKYLFSIFLVCFYVDANATIYHVDMPVNPFGGTSANVIDAGSWFELHNNGTINGEIVLDVPVTYLYNNGTIDGPINTNGNNLYVYNSGTVNHGIVNSEAYSNVIQIINSDTGVNVVDVTGGVFLVRVENVNNLDFSQIQTIPAATSLTITDSTIVIDDFSTWNTGIILDGNINLVINHADTVNSGDVISHASNPETINVQIKDLDKMYKPELEFIGGEIIIRIVRETNYDVVFDKETGHEDKISALELIRNKKPNDRLLRALDSAHNMDEFVKLKNSSYRFKHDILFRPIKVINNFALMETVKSETGFGIGITPNYIVSDKMDAVGGRVYAAYKNDTLYFNAGLSLNKFDYKDDINEFSGLSYGLDIESKQIFGDLWLYETLGMSLTDFKAEYISVSDELKENPLALSWFGDIRSGYDFNVMENFVLAPTIGFAYQYYSVADVSDTDSYVHGGMDAKYSFVMDGIKYEYSLTGAIGTNGNIFATTGIGFMSMTDNAGVSLNAGFLKDDVDCYYKFSIDAKVLF